MTTIDFENGEVWIVDKPYEWTSADVVNKLKYYIGKKTGNKKFKIGHAGTLDPLATGILLVCIGKKTKEIDQIQAQKKEYTGIITLGSTTASYDLETPIEQEFDISQITNEKILAAAKSLEGEQLQYAPLYSAKKIDGERAYKLARNGVMKEIKPHAITIYAFEITKIEMPHVYFRVECSKGTYIRTLANDLGKKMEIGSHLRELRRTKNGEFQIENGRSLQSILENLRLDDQPIVLKPSRKYRRTE
jgi:tRNA pseudouridine55 synthase